MLSVIASSIFITPYEITFLAFILIVFRLDFFSLFHLRKDALLFVFGFSVMWIGGMAIEYKTGSLSIFRSVIKFSVLSAIFVFYSRFFSSRPLVFLGYPISFFVLIFMVLIGIISLYVPISSLLGQDWRGLSKSSVRATGIYVEPGMFANTVIILFLIAFVNIKRVNLGKNSIIFLFFISILGVLISKSLAGVFLILAASVALYERNIRNTFLLILLISIGLVFFDNGYLLSRIVGMYNIIRNPVTSGLEMTSDPSAALKVSNMFCFINRDLVEILNGSGVYANYRFTFDNVDLNGRGNISDGCAFINSNGWLFYILFSYGIYAALLLFLIAYRFYICGVLLLLPILFMLRVGDSAAFYAVIYYLYMQVKHVHSK